MQFRAPFLSPERHAFIHDVVLGICHVRPDGSLDPTARWATTVEVVDVRDEKGDGRSGATVLDANVTSVNDSHRERRIIKVGNAAAIAQEWRAVQSMICARPSRVIKPVIAVSGFIEDAGRASLPQQLAAIVYDHVAEVFPFTDEPVVSLDDLIRDDSVDSERVAKVIAVLTGELRRNFWGGERRSSQTLVSLNSELGVDLVLEVNSTISNSTLSYDDSRPGQHRATLLTSSHVLDAATTLEPPGTTSLEVGTSIELRGITAKPHSRHSLVGTLGHVSVEIRCVGDALRHVDLTRDSDCHDARDLVVVGRVAAVRTLSWWDRIRRWDPEVTLEAEAIELDGIRVGQPFAGLTSLITEELPLRAKGMTHGDLNPRNILIVGGLVYAIDFARADNRPPLTDPAWLEICLLRDIYASLLGTQRLVRLQRLLGLASSVVDSMPDRWDSIAGLAIRDEDIERAFRILWSVRCSARNWYRGGLERHGWWHDYLAHLTLAGLRTLKWDDTRQSKEAVHAVLAATGVAAEWLGGNPYRHWLETDRRQAALQILPQVRAGAAEAGTILSDLVAAIDDAGVSDDEMRDTIETSRDACVAVWYVDAATKMLSDHDRNPNQYISLRALQGRPADAPRGLDALSERYQPMGEDPTTAAEAGSPDAVDAAGAAPEPARRRTPDLLDASNAIDLASSARSAVVVLLGEAGSGKTSIARELQARHATAVVRAGAPSPPAGAHPSNGAGGNGLPPMVPVTLTALQIDQAIQNGGAGGRSPDVAQTASRLLEPALGKNVNAALRLGGVHITVDGFNDLDPNGHGRVAGWIRALHHTYQRIRIIVCHRSSGFDPEELPFVTLVPQQVSDQEAREYIRNRFRHMDVPEHEEKAEELIRALTGDGVNESIRELAQTPRFLWVITDWFAATGKLPARPGDLVRGLTERYLRERLEKLEPPGQFSYETCVNALETLAGHLHDTDNATDEATAVEYLAEHTDHPQELLNLLIGSELISRAGPAIGFHRRAFQQYFAAVTLRRQEYDVQAFVERLLSHQDRDALEIMFLFADGSRELAHELMDPALKADPVFAARLLRWTDGPYHEDMTRFLSEQEQTLLGRNGEHACNAAVNALFEYGTDPARHLLHKIARSDDADPFARSAALAGLLRMRGATPLGRRRSAADRDTTETVRRLLDGSTQRTLRVNAINAVVDGRLRSLVAYLAGLIDDTQPWPVLRAARRSLASLDQILEPSQQATYVAACARRLPECEAERLRAIESATVEELQDERWELIEVLSHAGRLDLVLPTRFSYAPAEHYYWSDRKRLTTAKRADVPDVAQPAWDVLHGSHSPSALVACFATDDDLVAVAAAHRLLAEGRGEARALVDQVSASSSPQKLLAVAGTIPQLADEGWATVRAVVSDLIETMQVDRLEPLAALLAGLPANKRSTKRLMLHAMTRLRETHPTLEHGPLERVFSQPPRWSATVISEIVRSGDAGRDLVIRGLSMALYANDARELEPAMLPPDAVEAIAQYRPRTAPERVTFVRACTSAGLVSGLDQAFVAAQDPETATLVELSTHPKYGAEMVCRLGEVLTCIGYLGQLAHEDGDDQRSEQAHVFLRTFGASGDRSVERGRLLGLAILGDWSPLLTSLWANDRPMHRGARNAIALWRSGPCTPSWGSDDRSVAKRIGERLARTERSLAPDVRSTLAEIKTLVERRIGQIILPNS